MKEILFVTESYGFLGSYFVDALQIKSNNIKTFELYKNNYSNYFVIIINKRKTIL